MSQIEAIGFIVVSLLFGVLFVYFSLRLFTKHQDDSAFEEFGNALNDLRWTMGDVLRPTLEDVLDRMTQFLNKEEL